MLRILLVEDNEMNRDMLHRRLERHDYEVLLAADGQSAIDVARRERPAVVLMDLGLPIVDGWTAIRTLKDAPATRDIPIIALTGHVMAADEQRARAAGCDAFHAKPIDMPSLLAEIQRLSGQAAPRPPSS